MPETKITLSCGHCNGQLEILKSRVRRGDGKFCSVACCRAFVKQKHLEVSKTERPTPYMGVLIRIFSNIKLGKIFNGTPCWELQVGRNKDRDYTRIKYRGVRIMGHRLTYQLFVGPIPEGFDNDHLCRVHNCINPLHVEPVTTQVNILRGEGHAAKNAVKTHCDYGHELSERKAGAKQRYCKICRRLASQRYRERQAALTA